MKTQRVTGFQIVNKYVAAVAFGVCALGAANGWAATLYKWVGAPDASWRSLSSYTVSDGTSDVTPTVLPGPEDTVVLSNGEWNATNLVVVPAADLDYVAGLDHIGMPRYAGIVLNIQTDSVFRVAINGGQTTVSNDWSRSGRIVKQGPGALTLSSANRYSPSAGFMYIGDYLCDRIIVEEGKLLLAPERQLDESIAAYVPQLDVAAGAEIHVYEEQRALQTMTVDDLHGEGTICCNSPTEKVIQNRNSSIWDFSGRLVGNVRLKIRAMDQGVNLRGSDNTFGQVLVSYYEKPDANRSADVGFIGGSQSPTDPDSFGTNKLVGCSTFNARFTYLGGPGGTCAKTFNWNNCYIRPEPTGLMGVFDGGEVGGLTLTSDSAIQRGRYYNLYPMRFVFTGQNPTECVFAGAFLQPDNGLGQSSHFNTSPVAIVKEGPGVWHLADNARRQNTGVVAVNEGALRFDSIAPAGTICSLGYGFDDHRYDPALTAAGETADYTTTLPRVPYHLRIGHDGKRGTLEYCGTSAAHSYSRVLAVDGEGALINSSASDFTLSGIMTLGEGAHTLVLGGDTAAASMAKDITVSEGATLSVVKEGCGAWTLDGANEINGSVTVKEGALTVRNPKEFKYFRMTVPENYVLHQSKTPSWSNSVYFLQFALYDAQGVRRGCNLSKVGPTAPLTPGTVRVTRGNEDMKKFEKVFDPTVDVGALDPSKTTVLNSNKRLLDPEDEDSWVAFEMRLADGTPEITAFDYVTYSYSGSAYGFTVPYAFVFEGSADGLTWTELCKTNGLAIPTSSTVSKRWASDPENERGDVAADRPGKGFTFTRRAISENGVSPIPMRKAGPIAVAANATLAYEGVVAPIGSLAIDVSATACGTIRGATLAESGVVTLTNVPEGKIRTDLPLMAFEDAEGLENLANWQVEVGGKTGRFNLAIRDGRLYLVPHGLVLIVR